MNYFIYRQVINKAVEIRQLFPTQRSFFSISLEFSTLFKCTLLSRRLFRVGQKVLGIKFNIIRLTTPNSRLGFTINISTRRSVPEWSLNETDKLIETLFSSCPVAGTGKLNAIAYQSNGEVVQSLIVSHEHLIIVIYVKHNNYIL